MYIYYPWLKFIHIAAGFTFMMTHGASIALSFRMKKETHVSFFRTEHHLERVQAYLDLAGETWMAAMTSLAVLIVSGVVTGFLGNWWSRGWIWTSIIILALMMWWMVKVPTREIHDLRQAVGLPYRQDGKVHPPDPPQKLEDIEHMLDTTHPWLTTGVGYGGMIVVIWLMMFKPF